MRIDGLEEAFEHLNSEIGKIENAAQAGFWEAGLKIMRRSQQNLRASVITGNLRASGYVRNTSHTERPETEGLDESKSEPIPTDEIQAIGVELGFTANYALYAHENMEGRAPKFLEYPVVQNVREIVEIIKLRSGGK